jgi:hypothetical protein
MSGQKLAFNTTHLYRAAASTIAVLAFVCATRAVGQITLGQITLDQITLDQDISGYTCRPTLAISDVHFTEMQPPTLSRTWSAVVAVDAAHCAANATGTFEIVFVREKEIGPDLEFRERFVWRAPSVKVQVDFAADEAVQSYRIDNVTACDCGG